MLQISLQIENEILDIINLVDTLHLNDRINGDESIDINGDDFSLGNIEELFIINNENLYESEEEFNNEETESSSIIVANPDDCIPVSVENYQEFPEEESEMMLEEMNGTGGFVLAIFYDCQVIKRCESTFIARIGFNCMCKEEITCIHLY